MSKSIRARYAALHNQFGTAGLALSVVAIVLALGGGAYAANHATASKAKAGPRGKTGKTGPAGPAGPNGLTGATGPAGTNGTNGTAGTNGTNGTSAEAVSFTGNEHGCEAGGLEVKSGGPVKYVCNGKKGANGTPGASPTTRSFSGAEYGCKDGGILIESETAEEAVCNGEPGAIHPGETLPEGASETGTWFVEASPEVREHEEQAFTTISFPIPLPAPIVNTVGNHHVFFIEAGGASTTECPGTIEEPEAAEGDLCVYVGSINPGVAFASALSPQAFGGGLSGTGTVGAILRFSASGEERAVGFGSWAVTAE